MKNKIALVGLMGCGKTSVAKELSNFCHIDVFELDKIFEEKFNLKIKDYFKKYGEETFRIEENIILKDIVLSNSDFILSCGGGVILNENNRDILFNSDITTIYLKTSCSILFERLKNDTTRPLLMVNNPYKELKILITAREKYYKLANIEINTDNKSIKKIAQEIISKI